MVKGMRWRRERREKERQQKDEEEKNKGNNVGRKSWWEESKEWKDEKYKRKVKSG